MTDGRKVTLRTVLGTYPHTAPLKQGSVASELVALDFVGVKPIYKAFRAMVREQPFDVCEMAIVTYLQARAYGHPMVLLPAVVLGRLPHGSMLHDATRGTLSPSGLAGRRVGVRSYTQTPGVWLRGILANDYDADVDRIQWVTFEDAHVAEYHDPPEVERAAADADMTAVLLAGELDAAIYGGETPSDPRLRSVIPAAQSAAIAWCARRGVTPINHVVVVREALARSRPDLVKEVYRLLLEAKRAARVPPASTPDLAPFGIDANRPALQLIIDYCVQQRLVPRRLTVDELFDDVASDCFEA